MQSCKYSLVMSVDIRLITIVHVSCYNSPVHCRVVLHTISAILILFNMSTNRVLNVTNNIPFLPSLSLSLSLSFSLSPLSRPLSPSLSSLSPPLSPLSLPPSLPLLCFYIRYICTLVRMSIGFHLVPIRQPYCDGPFHNVALSTNPL